MSITLILEQNTLKFCFKQFIHSDVVLQVKGLNSLEGEPLRSLFS